MSVIVFPILALAAMGAWYFWMYKKGQSVGGGIAEGFALQQREKWADVLSPGEDLKVLGSGVLWRPAWQYWLAKQFPILKLVWPMKIYSLIITDRGRVLLGTYGSLGGLSEKEGHDKGSVRLSDVVEEQQSWMMKLNPLVKAGTYKTFGATLNLPSRALKLYAVPGDFVNALGA